MPMDSPIVGGTDDSKPTSNTTANTTTISPISSIATIPTITNTTTATTTTSMVVSSQPSPDQKTEGTFDVPPPTNCELLANVCPDFNGWVDNQGVFRCCGPELPLVCDKGALCSTITEIHLSGRNLNGAIPQFIGNIQTLRVLDLSKNNLNGTIPSNLLNSSTIEELYLNDNQLTGTISPSNWKKSLALNLSNNTNLEGNLSPGFGQEPCNFINTKICPPADQGLSNESCSKYWDARCNKRQDDPATPTTTRETDNSNPASTGSIPGKTSSPENLPQTSQDPNIPIVVGGSVGAVAIVALISIGIFMIHRRIRSQSRYKHDARNRRGDIITGSGHDTRPDRATNSQSYGNPSMRNSQQSPREYKGMDLTQTMSPHHSVFINQHPGDADRSYQYEDQGKPYGLHPDGYHARDTCDYTAGVIPISTIAQSTQKASKKSSKKSNHKSTSSGQFEHRLNVRAPTIGAVPVPGSNTTLAPDASQNALALSTDDVIQRPPIFMRTDTALIGLTGHANGQDTSDEEDDDGDDDYYANSSNMRN